MLGLLHDTLSDANNEVTAVVPFVVGDVFSSALTLATYLKDLVEAGSGWNEIEKFFVQVSYYGVKAEGCQGGGDGEEPGGGRGLGQCKRRRVWLVNIM